MAVFYIAAGVMHFVKPAVYVSIMPPYFPARRTLVFLSGIAEVLLGLALLPVATRPAAAWGIVGLLVAIFPANVYMATSDKFRRIPKWLRWARLPLQGVLVWWALQYA
jgi:uncharacterized membrane protein